jgi:hypothetical protein
MVISHVIFDKYDGSHEYYYISKDVCFYLNLIKYCSIKLGEILLEMGNQLAYYFIAQIQIKLLLLNCLLRWMRLLEVPAGYRMLHRTKYI